MKIAILLFTTLVGLLHGQHYNHTKALFKQLFNADRYNPQVRPMLNQAEAIYVDVYFSLLSIEYVDDTRQRFVCNGFLSLYWDDQLIPWDPAYYGDVYLIHPLPKQLWRPRIVLLNTLGERDLFADDISPIVTLYNGTISWNPGSLFATSCRLSLLKYPFDEQNCMIQMLSMGLPEYELRFTPKIVLQKFYSINGEWELLETNITTSTRPVDDIELSSFEIHFRIKRRPTFYVLNIILPFVCLSFLNLLIFTIPQESGEKIGYGITVQLALSFFLSAIGEMLPKSSETVPYIFIYFFILFVISTLSVLDSIIIVFLYYIEERDEHHQNVLSKLKRIARAITWKKKVVSTFSTSSKKTTTMFTKTNIPSDQEQIQDPDGDDLEVIELYHAKKKGPKTDNKDLKDQSSVTYKTTAASLDMASFFIFVLSWVSVTVWFFMSATS